MSQQNKDKVVSDKIRDLIKYLKKFTLKPPLFNVLSHVLKSLFPFHMKLKLLTGEIKCLLASVGDR